MYHNYELASKDRYFIRFLLSIQEMWLETSHVLLFRPLFFLFAYGSDDA